MKVIEVASLVKRYRKANKNAIDGISLSVEEGQFFALLGPNGAGKTTTISILTTTLSKTSGDIKIAGFETERASSQVRQNIGIIFQNPSLDQNLTAEENIRLHCVLYGLYGFQPLFSLMPQSYKKRLEELSNLLDIEDEIHHPIKTFSGGMKRKLEIIRSLMHHPKVLFLDEPTIGLDPVSRKNLWQYLKQIRDGQKITIFLTTHYLEEAEDADYVAIIVDGRIISEGTPAKIKRNLIVEYLLLDAKNKTQLISDLAKIKVRYDLSSPIKVYLDKLSAQQIISSISTPLSTLMIHTPSLSDAYIEIVERNGKND